MIDASKIHEKKAQFDAIAAKEKLTDEDRAQLKELNTYVDAYGELQLKAKAALQELLTKMNTQDNRATATPYYYQLRCPIRINCVDSDNSDGSEWINEENEIVDSVLDFAKEIIEDEGDESPLEEFCTKNDIQFGTSTEDNDNDIELLATSLNLRRIYYRNSHEYREVFFTEEAAFKFLAQNKHRYPEGTDTYVQCGYRNYEMESIFTNIGLLVNTPYEKK